jgi:hypothetical protein
MMQIAHFYSGYRRFPCPAAGDIRARMIESGPFWTIITSGLTESLELCA